MRKSLFVALAMLGVACAQPEPTATPSPAQGWKAVTVAQGIVHPWGMAWLPDGDLLITGREGTLHRFRGNRLTELPLQGLTGLYAEGQGGLMDIALHPKFSENRYVYFTASLGSDAANRTSLLRGVYDGKQVKEIRTLFQVEPAKSGGQHFGSRLLWLPDGTLLMSIGDGGNPPQRVGDRLARDQAQNPQTHHGSVLRLTDEGKAAPGNPKLGGRPEIWSLGHRNIQGLARDPNSGRIWASEHGPRGGDEINLLEPGGNYGWPLQSYGADYVTRIAVGKEKVPGMIDPKVVWVPSPAPSGLAFYTGKHFPSWQGSLFSGGLAGNDIRRVALDGQGNVIGQNQLPMGHRIRDVRQGPDGYLYVLTDEQNGLLLRIEPQQ